MRTNPSAIDLINRGGEPSRTQGFIMVMVLNEQIKNLIALQKIDAEVYQLKKTLSAQPLIQQKKETEFEKKKASLKTAEEQSKALQLKQKDKEGELQVKEEKIKKLQAQLYQLKSNKEYTAMEFEIRGLKADKSLLEEEILRLLDLVDQAKAKSVKEKELLSGEEKKLKDEIEALKKMAAEINADLSTHEEKRHAYVPNVETRLLAQYEKILKNREGLALVPVKNDSCGGCHMELPPQAVHEIKLQEKVMVCESCARILYWPP